MSVEPLADVITGEVIEVALTPAQARDLTDRIRQTLHVGHDLIVEAFKGSAWSVLGYASWDSYCAGEFAGARMVRLDRSQAREVLAEMKAAGMSDRAISSGLGLPRSTVRDHIAAAQVDGSVHLPEEITGTDGKTYQPPTPPSPAPPQPVIKERARKRVPLFKSFRETTRDLEKNVQKLVNLLADDRFPQNAEQVATGNRGDLIRAAEALAGVLDRLNTTNLQSGDYS